MVVSVCIGTVNSNVCRGTYFTHLKASTWPTIGLVWKSLKSSGPGKPWKSTLVLESPRKVVLEITGILICWKAFGTVVIYLEYKKLYLWPHHKTALYLHLHVFCLLVTNRITAGLL